MTTYKVWVNPKRGDAYYYSFKNLGKAMVFGKKLEKRGVASQLPIKIKGRGLEQMEYPIPAKKLGKAYQRQISRKSTDVSLLNNFI